MLLTGIRIIHPVMVELMYVSGKLLRLVYVYCNDSFIQQDSYSGYTITTALV